MANLLPVSQKVNIQKTYNTRLFIVMLIFLLAFVCAGIFTLLPAAFLSFVKAESSRDRLKVTLDIISIEERKNIQTKIADINQKIKILSHDLERDKTVSQAIEKIIEHKNLDVSLKSFFYNELNGESSDGSIKRTIIISGNAQNRPSLVLFINTLRAEEAFSQVDVPISNFVRNINIPFSLSITINDHGISQ